MNEIIQTWTPVVLALATAGAYAFTLWTRSISTEEAETKTNELRTELRGEIKALRMAIAKEMAERKTEHEKLEKTVVDHDRRMIQVEERLTAFPTVRDIAKLADQLSAISGKMEGMSAEMRGLHEGQVRQEKALTVINETLMQRS